MLASPLQLRTLANVTGAAEQRLWHYTLDCMARQPSSDPDSDAGRIQRIRDWITHGVTLDLRSQPAPIEHSNTYSVQMEAAVVRQRILEYVAFEALEALPDDHPCPYGVQPLHVIIKPDRKPRLVVDLSRNLNDHLEYEYFSYTTVSQAVDAPLPAAGSASSTCPTASCPSRCTHRPGHTSSSASKAGCISSRACRSVSALRRASAPNCCQCPHSPCGCGASIARRATWTTHC